MSKKEIGGYILAIIMTIVAVLFLRYAQAKVFYDGDMRCIFAECRINK